VGGVVTGPRHRGMWAAIKAGALAENDTPNKPVSWTGNPTRPLSNPRLDALSTPKVRPPAPPPPLPRRRIRRCCAASARWRSWGQLP